MSWTRGALFRFWVALCGVMGAFAVACTCSPPALADELAPQVKKLGAHGVTLGWAGVRGAEEISVFVRAEPFGQGSSALKTKRVKKLTGSATEVELNRLVPGVDYFLRLEVKTPRGVQRKEVHVTTPAADRTARQVQLARVAFVAPNVMRVDVHNGDGNRFARGWRLRRSDGKSIAVRRVNRHSVPVAQPAYNIGFGAEGDDLSQVVTEHRLYLHLGESVGHGEVLDIEGPLGVAAVLPFSDCYLETPLVQLNQVGYNPRAEFRWAYFSAYMGDGGGLGRDAMPKKVEVLKANGVSRAKHAANLPVVMRSYDDGDAGVAVAEVDLSGVRPTPGALRIRVPNVGVSRRTALNEEALFEAYYVTARGMFHNRWAGDLSARYTDYTRPVDHGFAFVREQANPFEMFPRSERAGGRRLEIKGGHHDAGDFDIRPMHTVVAQVLMRAYELRPSNFADGQLTLPESGNGIPDILDEALFSIAAWEALQESDGGVRAGVESTRHPWGVYPAHQDKLDYFTYARDPQVSMRAAGLFAQAARLIKRFDGERATRLRSRAEKAFAWARGRGARPPFVLYGSGELYRLTGDAKYRAVFEETWRAVGPYGAFSRFADRHNFQGDYAGNDGLIMPDYILGYLGANPIDPGIAKTAKQWLTNMADKVARETLTSPHAHRNPRPVGRPMAWGQGSVMGRYMDPIIARMSLGGVPRGSEQLYLDAMSVAADYVLGANPLGISYITGLGTDYPREPLHLDSLVYVQKGRGPMPGLPVYGPVENLPRADYYRHATSAFHPGFERLPLGQRYGDVRSFVVTNECTIWECQAPHSQHFGLLLQSSRPVPKRLLPKRHRR